MNPLLACALVALGGGAGSAARFAMTGIIDTQRSWRLPLGTMSVNILGSFIIGIVAALIARAAPSTAATSWHLVIATGFCGGFTTFSTATVESLTLARSDDYGAAVVSVAATLAATIGAVALGFALVTVLD